MTKPMDKQQLAAFVDYMIGWMPIGVAGEEEITRPICPQMRAFVVARLGEQTPDYGYLTVKEQRFAAPLAQLLREVADGIDPPVTGSAP